MRALWLEKVGGPLVVVERPDARPAQIGVIVRVLTLRVPGYTRATPAPSGDVRPVRGLPSP
jgi:hypothetical protein